MDLTYTITANTLRGLIQKEISTVAFRARTDSGDSLFDTVKTTSRDNGILDSYVEEAVNNILVRLTDMDPSYASSQIKITAPDIDSTTGALVPDAIEDYLIKYAVAFWLLRTYPSVGDFYKAQADTAMERLVSLVRHRQTPQRP